MRETTKKKERSFDDWWRNKKSRLISYIKEQLQMRFLSYIAFPPIAYAMIHSDYHFT